MNIKKHRHTDLTRSKKTTLKNIIILLGFVFIGFQNHAQPLDLEACLKMADTASIAIRNSRLDIASNKEIIDAQHAALMPKLNFIGDYRFYGLIPGQLFPAEFSGGTPGTYNVVKFGVPFNFNNTVQLTQTIYNPLLKSGLNSLDVNQKIIELQSNLTTQNTKYQVYQTFFNLQAITKQLVYIESNLQNTDKLLANIQAMIAQKLILPIEEDKLKVNRLNLVNQQQKLMATKNQMEHLLRILTGMESNSKIELVSDDLIEKSILIDKSERHNTEIDIINAQLELNALEKTGLKMGYLPTFAFYAAYNYSYNIRPETDFAKGINSAFLGIRIDWTLFDGLEKHNKATVNKIQAEKLENQLRLVDQQLEMATSNAQKQVEIQINSLMISKEQLTLSEKIYTQTELAFKAGVTSSTDIIKAENDLNQAQSNVISSYVQLRQAELDFLKSTGNLN